MAEPKTITSANAVFTLLIPQLSAVPITVQGFATDDSFSQDEFDVAETVMGVDGVMSSGFLPSIKPQAVHLQANSDSINDFEALLAAQEAIKEIIPIIAGNITMSGNRSQFVMTRGTLKKVKRIDGKKTLQPATYTINWQQVQTVPII